MDENNVNPEVVEAPAEVVEEPVQVSAPAEDVPSAL